METTRTNVLNSLVELKSHSCNFTHSVIFKFELHSFGTNQFDLLTQELWVAIKR